MTYMQTAEKVKQKRQPNKVKSQDEKNSYDISRYIYIIIKRLCDIAVGLIGMIILIPLTLIVFTMRVIKKENDGPIFYTQLRIGKNGKQFKLYKFRTMCMNADEKLKDYLKENEKAKQEYKKYKKLKEDPRITKVGSFLRKTSIDEFPQFLNVLLGNMSLVGPRPYLPREREDMGDYYNDIIKCKPGITGYWQANGRSNITFEERLKMDQYYEKKRGFIMDVKIVIKTILQLLMGSTAL